MTTLSGSQDREAARRRAIEHIADGVLEHLRPRPRCRPWPPRPALTKSRMPSGGKPRRRRPDEGRHARIVPAAHVTLAHQPQQHALGHDGVREVESRELVLVGPRRHRQVVDEPVVERPVVLELERADRVGDALDRVGLAVGEVVGRIDAPRVARPRMLGVQDAVQHRVAQVDVGRGHVDPRPQHARAVGELAGAHAREEVEVLLGRPVAPRALAAGLGERAAVLADLVGRQVVDVGLAGLDEVDGPLVELLEVVGGEVQVLAPVEAEPADVGLDGVDVLLLFLGRGSCRRSAGGSGRRTPGRCRS